jgi:AhpD family alkylhydroperoxidase
MLNWLDYRKQLAGRIGQLATLSPETVKGYQTLSKAGAASGHLDAKTRELIALAVAVTARCDGCITVHTAEAVKLGASRGEIAEALGVAVALNAGAAMVYSARVLDAVDAYAPNAISGTGSASITT